MLSPVFGVCACVCVCKRTVSVHTHTASAPCTGSEEANGEIKRVALSMRVICKERSANYENADNTDSFLFPAFFVPSVSSVASSTLFFSRWGWFRDGGGDDDEAAATWSKRELSYTHRTSDAHTGWSIDAHGSTDRIYREQYSPVVVYTDKGITPADSGHRGN